MKISRKITLISITIIAVVVGAGLIMFAPRSYEIPEVTPVQDSAYRFMTYNLKNSGADSNTGNERKAEIANLIEAYGPDSIGMQEADEEWMDFLPSTLENYSYVGVGRDDGDTEGEYTPIFYLTDKFNVLDNGTFWLSETPVEVSYGWDAVCRRICTYIVLENNETGEVFAHFNTHFDHVGEEAREKSADLIIAKIGEMGYPSVFTGDLNFYEGNTVYETIQNSILSDTKYLAANTMKWGTFNAFRNFHMRYIRPIDFIFVTDESIQVNRYEVLYQHRYNDKPLSDHFPIFSDISFITP